MQSNNDDPSPSSSPSARPLASGLDQNSFSQESSHQDSQFPPNHHHPLPQEPSSFSSSSPAPAATAAGADDDVPHDNDENENHLLQENEQLKIQLLDLKQRLQNSLQLLSSQQQISTHLLHENNKYKHSLHHSIHELNLNKNQLFLKNKQQMKEKEYLKYEKNKKKYEILQQDLRLGMIDYEISKTKKIPMKLMKLKEEIERIEKNQNSQKELLVLLSLQEKLIEDLSSASQQNNLLECKNLIRRGVNVNEIDSAGFLPIHYACSAGSVAVVQLLLEFGSNYTSYLTGMSPMVLAADGGHSDVIRLLASFGANINESGIAGTPPIVAAAGKGHLQAVETLLALHAFVDAQDIEGNAALHFAAKLEKPVPLLRVLLLHGANPKLLNGLGHTPLQVALNCLNVPAMEILGGSSSDSVSQEGEQSLLLADSMILNGSVDSLPLQEKSYISDISESVVLQKPKEERKGITKSSTRNKVR